MPKKEIYEAWVKEFKTKRTAQIPYNIYTKILDKEFNAKEVNKSHSVGSKRAFRIAGTAIIFVIHEPHGSSNKNVSKWDHQNIYDILKLNGKL